MRKPREDFKTQDGVFDQFTVRTLKKLITENHFDGLSSPISIGKESSVFAAETKDGTFVAVKIYRLETCDFNHMYDYIRSDPRFSGLLRQKRKVIFAWAQREFRNLMRAHDMEISSPLPITVKNNVLVEEFIGDSSAAPRMIQSPPIKPKLFLKKLLKDISTLYKNDLTHGDLSAYNILNFKESPVIIDFSQATIKDSPRFNELFLRDVNTITNDFNKLGCGLIAQKVINQIKAGSII
jgi:RIO kinase 1